MIKEHRTDRNKIESGGREMRLLFISAILILAIAGFISGSASAAEKPAPYAQLTVSRDEKTGSIALTLVTHGRPGGDVTARNTAPKGIEILEKFDKWYEDLFSLTYLDNGYKRLWTQARKRGALLAKEFMTPEMLDALKGCELLVVVEGEKPFPVDAFRIGDRWLFEIAPIVHALTPGPKDLSDARHYASALVVDCQGPKDREGMEAPAVFKDLGDIAGIKTKLLISLTRGETVANLKGNAADVLHLATHAHPDEFFPGRNKPGIRAAELEKMKLRFRTVVSTGCNTGNPVFARGMLTGGAKFFIASIYVTSGKDGVAFGEVFYKELFSGKTPFESFYAVKRRIAGDKSDFPDMLRFAFFVK